MTIQIVLDGRLVQPAAKWLCRDVELRSVYSSSSSTSQVRGGGDMQYMLSVYDCERPEPGDPGFVEAMARVNAFADERRRRGVFVPRMSTGVHTSLLPIPQVGASSPAVCTTST